MYKTKKLTITALLCALALAFTVFGKFPLSSVTFLKYDPKDIIIVMGGFIFGPLTAIVVSIAVSLIEAFTISETGWIGCIMNIISSVAFAATASAIYRRKRTAMGAVVGLITGIVTMAAAMLVWNFIMTPLYMKIPRDTIASMLVPVFLPFNLLKGGINTAATLIIYKPFVTALRRSGVLNDNQNETKLKMNIGVIITAVVLIVMCVIAFNIVK